MNRFYLGVRYELGCLKYKTILVLAIDALGFVYKQKLIVYVTFDRDVKSDLKQREAFINKTKGHYTTHKHKHKHVACALVYSLV